MPRNPLLHRDLIGLGLLPADDVIERLRGFDSIISWYGTQPAGFRRLVADLGLPFRFLPALPECRNTRRGLLQSAGAGTGRFAVAIPEIRCPAAERSFAAIHPFASSVGKTRANAAVRADRQKLCGAMPVHWLCGPEEDLEGAIRIEDLYELAMWLRQARIFVGNDSGISHLAAAVGTPVAAFFRATDPRVWAPRGPSVNDVLFQSNDGEGFAF